jgi:hypothetical protein
MKICVGSFRGEREREEPTSFYLGARRLPVLAVVERWHEPGRAYYRVQVGDGRRFVLRYEAATVSWELVSVSGRSATGR